MKHSNTNYIDAYRIGYGPLFRWFQGPWLLLRAGRSPRLPDGALRRGSSDRWGRCWQAEWDGCQRAPRAWTRRGVLRKGERWRRRGIGGEES